MNRKMREEEKEEKEKEEGERKTAKKKGGEGKVSRPPRDVFVTFLNSSWSKLSFGKVSARLAPCRFHSVPFHVTTRIVWQFCIIV